MTPTPTTDTPAMTPVTEGAVTYRITPEGTVQIPYRVGMLGSQSADGWMDCDGMGDGYSYAEHHAEIIEHLAQFADDEE